MPVSVSPSPRRAVLAIVVLAGIGAFFALDLGRFLSLSAIKAQQASLAAIYADRPIQLLGAFFAAYVAVAALSLPGAAVMTLVAGAVFGLLAGTLLVSFASSLGATLAFLSSRYVLRDAIRRRFGARLADVDAGIERDGALYLFSLRIVPLIPFFVVNLLMGLTRMRTRTFYLVSQLGMLAGTVVYVNAGTQLGRVESLRGVLSPSLVGSFVLLGTFPIAARRLLAIVQRNRARATVPGKRSNI